MSTKNLWPLVQEITQAYSPYYQEAMQPVIAAAGLQAGDWFITFLAYGIEPQPLTAAFLNTIFPYTNPETQQQRLADATRRGLLQTGDDTHYRLTPPSRQGMIQFYQVTSQAIAPVNPLPEEKMNRIATLLHRIVEATEATSTPDDKPQLLASRRTDPGPDAAASVRIDQYCTDLVRYRHDAHGAAWHSLDIAGPAWEVLTLLWQEGANSAETLAEQLSNNRNFTAADYTTFLKMLEERGWAEKENGTYRLTETGRQVREEAEATTDRYFYSGQTALSEEESARLNELLVELRDGLRQGILSKAWQRAATIPAAWAPLYRPQTGPVLEEVGLSQPGYFFILWQLHSLSPEPITAERLHKRLPYSANAVVEEWFTRLAEAGFVTAAGEGHYQITEKGRQAVKRVDDTFADALGALAPLPENNLQQLVTLLGRVADAGVEAPQPAEKWALSHNRRLHREGELPLLLQLDEYLDDLAAYRDDAHLAAFRSYDVDAHAWEALTLLWREDLNTAEALVERLPRRGYDAEAYEKALQSLVQRGWLAKTNGTYALTTAGRQVREEAEALTDQYFFTPWDVLTLSELVQLDYLLRRLQNNLQNMANDEAAAARADLWSLAEKISGSLFVLTRNVIDPLNEELGIAQQGLPFTLLQVRAFDPQPLSAEKICRRFPYAAPASWEAHLAALQEKGFLARNDKGSYGLTADGRRASERFLSTFSQRVDEIETAVAGTLPTSELDTLATLLEKVVEACMNAPQPPGNWCIRHSLKHVSGESPPLLKIDQHLDDLNAFRDDAHLAAFAPHHISGHAWELLTALWNGEVKNAAEMAEQKAFRGHSQAVYQEALEELVKRNWAEKEDEETYRLTETGQSVRQTAETLTDRYFYTPWTTLNDEETAQLRDLLTQLETTLKQMAEPVPAS